MLIVGRLGLQFAARAPVSRWRRQRKGRWPESPCAHTLMSDHFHPSSVPTGTYHPRVNDKGPHGRGPLAPLTSVHETSVDAGCRVGIGFCLPRLPVCGLGGGWRRTRQTVRVIPIPTGPGSFRSVPVGSGVSVGCSLACFAGFSRAMMPGRTMAVRSLAFGLFNRIYCGSAREKYYSITEK